MRYLIHFNDGSAGTRHFGEPLVVGAELRDGAALYGVERFEPPPGPNAFGHAWARRIEGA